MIFIYTKNINEEEQIWPKFQKVEYICIYMDDRITYAIVSYVCNEPLASLMTCKIAGMIFQTS